MIRIKGNQRSAIALFISFLLVFAGCFTGSAVFADTGDTGSAPPAAALTDISGHWGEKAIKNAISAGFVKGYPDGTFRPDKAVTRAEFVTMVNNALQLRDSNKVNLLFTDVDKNAWYHDEVAKASYVRYVVGTSKTTFSPAANITRQEAAVMVSRFLPKAGMTGKDVLATFPDQSRIASWAEEGLAVAINKGYMKGHSSGLIAPTGTLTRAEAAVIITNILNGETIIREDTYVRVSGDILRDKIYVGDIIIDKSVGEGDATLENLSALSVVYVNGGGSHTVEMENSLIIRLVVTKEGTQVRVMAADGTTIYTTILFNNNLLVDQDGNEALPDGETFEDIVVVQGTVTSQQAQEIAAAIAEQIQSGNPVTPQQVAQAVQSVLTNSTTTTEQTGTIIVQVPSTPSDTGPRRPSYTVTVDGNKDHIGDILTAVVTPAEAAGTYQWKRIAVDGTIEEIEGATSEEYIIAMEDIGQYLVVTVTGTGSYGGPRSSSETLIGFAGGTGAAATPYQIANWYHLNNMRYLLDKAYLLTADLGGEEPVYETEGYEDVVLEYGWEPVGESYDLAPADADWDFTILTDGPELPFFTGSFDGDDKIIKDLIVDKTYEVCSASDTYPSGNEAGLFGVTYQAEIKDLRLFDPQIEGTDYVGALAGYIRETEVSNVHVVRTIAPVGVDPSSWGPSISGEYRVGGLVGRNDSGSIENCSNDVIVTGRQYVGGIAGSNFIEGPEISAMVSASVNTSSVYEATISGSSNSGNVYGYALVGGIVGGNGTTNEYGYYGYDDTATYILECYNTGSVIFEDYSLPEAAIVYLPMKFGGIAGGSSGVISECYNTGTVGTWWYPTYVDWEYIWAVGGIAGSTSGTIEYSYNTGDISGFEHVSGIVGYARDAEIVHNYNVGEITGEYNYDSNRIFGNMSDTVFEGNYYRTSMLRTTSEVGSAGISTPDYDGVYPVYLEEMRNPLTYVYAEEAADLELDLISWDFEEIWAMNLYDNSGLPFLRWQYGEDTVPTLEVTMPVSAPIELGQTLEEAVLEGGEVSLGDTVILGSFEYWDEFYLPEYMPGLVGMEAYVLFSPDNTDYEPFVGRVFVGGEYTDANEPNDTWEKATPLVVGEILEQCWIMPETDIDWFSFEAEEGKLYRILTRNLYPAGSYGWWMDTYIYLYADPEDCYIDYNDDYIEYDSSILWTCSESGAYYVEVMHYDQYNDSVEEGSVGRYDILVREENTNNYLINAGFEEGDFTGWDIFGENQYPVVQSEVKRSGNYAVHLGDGADGMYAPGKSTEGWVYTDLIQTFTIDPAEGTPKLSFYHMITDMDVNDYMEAFLYYPEYSRYVLIGRWNEVTDGWEEICYMITETCASIVELHIFVGTYNNSITNHYYLDDFDIEYVTGEFRMLNEVNDIPESRSAGAKGVSHPWK